MRFTDRLTAPDGEIVYANRGTIFGRIAHPEVYEDAKKGVDLGEYLTSHEPIGP